MAQSKIVNQGPNKRLQMFGNLVINSGDFKKKLSNYIKTNIDVYNSGIFVVGWYTGSPSNLPSAMPNAGCFIALLPRGLSGGIRVVELTTMTFGIVDYSPD